MRILVCGGRDYWDKKAVYSTLDTCLVASSHIEICEGGATGADYLARQWAEEHGIPKRTFWADWARHGQAAGAIRNTEMLRKFRPDLVVAFRGNEGTKDMVAKALKAGVKVETIDWSLGPRNLEIDWS